MLKLVILGAACFAVGAIAAIAVFVTSIKISNKMRKLPDSGRGRPSGSRKLGTMDIVLIVFAVFLGVFTVAMIVLYILTGAIPDTLCTCVFGVCGGECGVMGWIKSSKERYRERRWEVEDRRE